MFGVTGQGMRHISRPLTFGGRLACNGPLPPGCTLPLEPRSSLHRGHSPAQITFPKWSAAQCGLQPERVQPQQATNRQTTGDTKWKVAELDEEFCCGLVRSVWSVWSVCWRTLCGCPPPPRSLKFLKQRLRLEHPGRCHGSTTEGGWSCRAQSELAGFCRSTE